MSARGSWHGIDERLRVVIVIVTVVLVLVVSIAFFDRATRGRESTTSTSRGSARSTASDGAQGFRALLRRYGTSTRDQAGAIPADLASDVTLVILDGDFPANRDVERIRRFVTRGGHLVVAGPAAAEWAGLDPFPTTTSDAPVVRETVDGRAYRVRVGAAPLWRSGAGGHLLITRRHGAGRITLVSTSAPFRNDRLAEADNAAFALAVVGDRTVVFAEGAHGLSAATGYAAIPWGWKVALFGVPFALLLAAIARGRRIGGAEPTGRAFAPARREAVDVLGGAYERSKRPAAALASVGSRVRRDLCRRLDLPVDAPPDAIRAAARRAGWDDATVDAALVAPTTRDDVVALGRALARTQKGTP